MTTSCQSHNDLIDATRALALPDVCCVEDVAIHLKTTSKTVYRWLGTGMIPGKKIGRRWYIPRESLLAFLASPTLRTVCP